MTELQVVQSDPPPGFIDLGLGNPDSSLLPFELIGQAARKYFSTGDRRSLQYGLEQGDGSFRFALADFLAAAYEAPVDPSNLFVTTGASSALDLLCSLYTSPGDAVLVEEPAYYLALRIFEDHWLKVVPLPGDQDGLDLESLEGSLLETRPRLIYLVPTFQNPSGRTIPLEQREKIVELAQRQDVLLVADEVYHHLGYSQTPPPPFALYAKQVEQVISISSFSKILAPGLRLGWIQANQKMLKRLAGSGLLDSGGGMNPFTSALLRSLVESGGLQANINHLRTEYALRLEAMADALHRYLPEATWTLPGGGFFFWVRIPGVDTAEFRRKANEFNVDLRQGALFSSRKGLEDWMRLSFSFYPAQTIEEGVNRLRECLDSALVSR